MYSDTYQYFCSSNSFVIILFYYVTNVCFRSCSARRQSHSASGRLISLWRHNKKLHGSIVRHNRWRQQLVERNGCENNVGWRNLLAEVIGGCWKVQRFSSGCHHRCASQVRQNRRFAFGNKLLIFNVQPLSLYLKILCVHKYSLWWLSYNIKNYWKNTNHYLLILKIKFLDCRSVF